MPPRKRAGRKPVKRTVSKKRVKHGDLTLPLENSPYTQQEGVEQVLEHIEKTGHKPSPEKMEKKFPGITFNQGAMFELHCALVFRLRLRQYSHGEIQKALGISENQMTRCVQVIRSNLENSVYNINVQEHVGQSIAAYKEMQGMLMRIGASKTEKTGHRIDAIRGAASCEDKVLRALLVAGAYKEPVVPQRSLQPQNAKTPLNALQEAMAKILQADATPLAIEGGKDTAINLNVFDPGRI